MTDTSADAALFAFDDSYVRQLEGLYERWQADTAPAPRLLVLNTSLAAELGVDVDRLGAPDGVAALLGNAPVPGSQPVAMAYAGHQFGNYSPRLGDGRALLLGEVHDTAGRRRDLHLKGSGRTRFSRGGDGKAAVGPMLREYVIGEAMHALGIPTTRALAVVATGETIARETPLPGAVLVRVAASHLRVGTFQYASATGDLDLLERLTRYAIDRHHPEAAGADNPALALFEAVVDAQARLVATWMHVGFVHGVMNTDNTTISGETIDYGPCAFMDRADLGTVFSSIDHGGRYAYGNQPRVLQWNLARLAEALLPVIDEDQDRAVAGATEVLRSFGDRYLDAWYGELRRKLGVGLGTPDAFLDEVPGRLAEAGVDHTLFFRRLADAVRGDDAPVRNLFIDVTAFDRWAADWRPHVPATPEARTATADEMDRVNPVYVPRNHKVEEALTAATDGDLSLVHALVEAVTQPFIERAGLEAYAAPAPDGGQGYRTFCGT